MSLDPLRNTFIQRNIPLWFLTKRTLKKVSLCDTMKRVASIVLLISFMLPNLTKVGIIIDFKINQDYIAEVLCINRGKQMSTCNGKCYLSKQLNKAEEQEEKQVPNNKKERVELVYFHSKNSFDFIPFTDHYDCKLNAVCIDKLYTSSFVTNIFHPPKLNLI